METIEMSELIIKHPAHHSRVVVGDDTQQVVTITNDGRVTLAPGVALDEASLAFWRALEDLNPGICQRILDERAKKRGKP